MYSAPVETVISCISSRSPPGASVNELKIELITDLLELLSGVTITVPSGLYVTIFAGVGTISLFKSREKDKELESFNWVVNVVPIFMLAGKNSFVVPWS